MNGLSNLLANWTWLIFTNDRIATIAHAHVSARKSAGGLFIPAHAAPLWRGFAGHENGDTLVMRRLYQLRIKFYFSTESSMLLCLQYICISELFNYLTRLPTILAHGFEPFVVYIFCHIAISFQLVDFQLQRHASDMEHFQLLTAVFAPSGKSFLCRWSHPSCRVQYFVPMLIGIRCAHHRSDTR
jgi:hypothetical protein